MTGREAFTAGRAWRRLGRKARRDIVRRARLGQPAADPAQAGLAANWALAATWRMDGAGLAGSLIVAAACAELAIVGLTNVSAAVALLLMVPAYAIIATAAVRTRWTALVAAANLRHQLRDAAAVPATPLRVRLPRIRLMPATGAALLVTGVVVLSQAGTPANLVPAFCGLAGSATGALARFLLVRSQQPTWTRQRSIGRRRTVLTLDHEGVRLPTMRLSVPWSAIAAADLQPLAPRRQLPLGVAFAVPDPWQLLAANPDATLKARRMLAEDGWLSLPATALDVEPAVIVTAARAHLAEQPTIMA